MKSTIWANQSWKEEFGMLGWMYLENARRGSLLTHTLARRRNGDFVALMSRSAADRSIVPCDEGA